MYLKPFQNIALQLDHPILKLMPQKELSKNKMLDSLSLLES